MAGEGLSNADLERDWLLANGATGPTLADAREQVYGTDEHAYFAALSGLTPAQEFSLADHQLAYYRSVVDPDDLSLADTARIFWTTPVGPPDWSPAELSPFIWLDASDASTFTFSSGSAVSEWRDKSGAGNHFLQPTAGFQPLRDATVNGLAAVNFDGVDDLLQMNMAGSLSAQPFTIAIAWRMDTETTGTLTDNGTGGRVLVQVLGGPIRMFAGAVLDGPDSRPPAGGVAQHVAIFNGASSALRYNQAQVAAGDAGANVFGGAGVQSLGNGSLDATICEFIVCPGAVSGADLTDLETYLSTKWGTP